MAKVPNTISNREWANLQRRAHAAEAKSGGMFSAQAVQRRKASSAQLKNAKKN